MYRHDEMNGEQRRYSVQPPQPPYIEPPNSATHAADENNIFYKQLAYNNLTNQLDQLQRTNESLHSKLGQLSVHLNNVQHTSKQNAEQNILVKQENEKLKTFLQKMLGMEGIPSVDPRVDQRLRNMEDIIQKFIVERDIDRSDRLSASSGGISVSNISLVSSAHMITSEPLPLYKDASSTSEYSSLSSLDRVDGLSFREKVFELETNAVKQDARIKILERNLQEKNIMLKRQKAELDTYRHSQQQLPSYPREFTQSQI